MVDHPTSLDAHRGMAAQKATDLRRLRSEVEADQAALHARQVELEDLLAATPSSRTAPPSRRPRRRATFRPGCSASSSEPALGASSAPRAASHHQPLAEPIPMTRPSRRPLKHLGALHGSGVVSIENGQQSLGLVSYEIDGYLDRTTRSASGQIEGAVSVLAQAFRAGGASLAPRTAHQSTSCSRTPRAAQPLKST